MLMFLSLVGLNVMIGLLLRAKRRSTVMRFRKSNQLDY